MAYLAASSVSPYTPTSASYEPPELISGGRLAQDTLDLLRPVKRSAFRSVIVSTLIPVKLNIKR